MSEHELDTVTGFLQSAAVTADETPSRDMRSTARRAERAIVVDDGGGGREQERG